MGNTWSGNCGSPIVYEATGCGCGSGTSSDVGTKLWVMDQLTDFLANNKPVDYSAIIDDLRRRLENAEDGVHTTTTHITTATSDISTLETTVASNWQDNHSGILDLQTTMATKIDTTAVTSHVQQSLFGGNVDSYITSLITTYAAANLAFASDYAQLVAKFNTQQVTLTSLDQVVSGMFTQWNGVGTPQIGQFKYIGNVLYQYLGGTFGPNHDGWVRADNGAKDDAAQALAWAGGATKLITDPNGKITGWSFADGSNVRSQFDIYADDFRITDGTGTYTPFSIVGGVATFTGKVADSSGNPVPTGDDVAKAINNNTTTIDGSKITAGTITADTIEANSIAVVESFSVYGVVTSTLAFGTNLTAANSTSVGSFMLVNSSLTSEQKMLLTIAGRSGRISASVPDASTNFGIFIDGVKMFEYGWTPSGEDAKAACTTFVMPKNSSKTIDVRAAKSEATDTISYSLNCSMLGIKN